MSIIRKCMKCGAMVEVIKDCTCENCGIKCCGEVMQALTLNTTDASAEKHLPQIEIVGSYIIVNVPHDMTEEHHIEWIAMECDGVKGKKYLQINNPAKAVFPYITGSKVYSYCNKHGLWVNDVK